MIIFSLIICTLTSDFFPGHLEKKLGCFYKPDKNLCAKPEKKSKFTEPEIFVEFEIDLDF